MDHFKEALFPHLLSVTFFSPKNTCTPDSLSKTVFKLYVVGAIAAKLYIKQPKRNFPALYIHYIYYQL